nr:retrovirus-related Pol polyprotein from transposon TNT 1-94 [Tanacetum cinerariifolium]
MDPEDHLGIFSAAAEQEEWPMPICCKMFRQTLSGAARNLFDDLDPTSMDSFGELKLANKLNKKIPKMMDEMFKRIRVFIRREVAAGMTEVARAPQWDIGNVHIRWFRGQERNKGMSRLREFRRSMGTCATNSRRDTFIPLTKTLKEILEMENVNFPPPSLLIWTLEKKNLDKFCNYHGDRGHNTNDCYHLKKQIEEAVALGKLAIWNDGDEKPWSEASGDHPKECGRIFLDAVVRMVVPRVMDKVLVEQKGRDVEVYLEEVVINSKSGQDLIEDVDETLYKLQRVNMKLDPSRCTFGMEEGKFLGYMAMTEGIKADLKKGLQGQSGDQWPHKRNTERSRYLWTIGPIGSRTKNTPHLIRPNERSERSNSKEVFRTRRAGVSRKRKEQGRNLWTKRETSRGTNPNTKGLKGGHQKGSDEFQKNHFKQREENNDIMVEMFRLLKELTTSRTPEKVLVREKARHPITKNVSTISFVITEKENNIKNNEVVDKNVVELSELNEIVPKEVVDIKKEVEDEDNDEPVRNVEEEITGDEIKELVEMPRSQLVGYYLKHEINKKLIEGLIGNQRYNNSLLETCLGIAKDVLVEIAGYIYHLDFVILDITEDKKKPFVLGTPFLTTVKARLDLIKGIITLKYGKNKINFFKITEYLCKVEEGTESDIDPVTLTTIVSRLILEWEERIKLHQEKEMEFNQWRSKVFKDERFALVNKGCKQSESISNTCLVETDDSNVIPDSPDMCDDDIKNDQNDVESDDERVTLANLIANLKFDTEFEKYKAFNDRTVDNEKLEHKLNETLAQLAQKYIEIKEYLKLKAYEISVVKEKYDELIKQSLLTKSHYEGLFKQKTKDMDILIKTCLMPLALKTHIDSFIFVHELKQEMHADLKKNLISLELALQQCKEQVKNDTVCNEQALNVFQKEREQYFKIQDLKAQLQDKNIAISELKKLIEKCKGKSMETKFDKPSVVRQPNVQRILKPSILGVNHKTNVSRPQHRSNQMKDKVVPNNSQFALILGYRELVQGNITINMVYYIEGLNHSLFSVGQFCDADLEVAFWKSTCFVRDLQGNDLLTGNRGSDLYTISLQESTSSTILYLMSKASLTQAWLWHRRLSHLNFDYINLLSKKDVVIGLPKLKYVKDKLCYSCEVSKAKRSSFKLNDVPSLKGRLNLLHMDLCGLMGTKFLNKTLNAFFKEEGIKHQTSTSRTPEQNGIVKRQNQTSVANDTSGLVPKRQKASDYDNSDPDPQQQNVSSSADAHVPSQQELDLLFGPLYDEFSLQENNVNQAEEEHLLEDEFTNPLCTPIQEADETSSHNIGSSNVHEFNRPQVSEYQWTKDHPLEQVHRNPSKPMQIRRQLVIDPEICMFALTVSTAEQKNIKEAMADST